MNHVLSFNKPIRYLLHYGNFCLFELGQPVAQTGPPNNLFFWKYSKKKKKTTEYFLKFLFFIWKYNPCV